MQTKLQSDTPPRQRWRWFNNIPVEADDLGYGIVMVFFGFLLVAIGLSEFIFCIPAGVLLLFLGGLSLYNAWRYG